MRMLIFVNKFDKNDDLSGFFISWARKLAESLERVIVVTQEIGEFDDLPNLRVVSVEKSKNGNPIVRAIRYLNFLFKFRKDYDAILVMMAPSWSIISSLTAGLLGKKSYLWYAVWQGDWRLKLAERLVDNIFCSVKEAFPLKTSKLVLLGQGIDTDSFRRIDAIEKRKNSILFLGRISPVKNLETLIGALNILNREGLNVDLTITGEIRDDNKYHQKIFKETEGLKRAGLIHFLGKIPNYKTPELYNAHEPFINLTEGGSFDKSILEAMACQTLVLVSNKIYERIFNDKLRTLLMFKEKDPVDLAVRIKKILELPEQERRMIGEELRRIVLENHSLKNLTSNLIRAINANE